MKGYQNALVTLIIIHAINTLEYHELYKKRVIFMREFYIIT